MKQAQVISRRAFVVGTAAALPLAALGAPAVKHVPVGLELYSVRDELKKDESTTLQQVAKMGYECVEFYAPYYEWTPAHAKQVRKQLDDVGLKCYSTHNGKQSFSDDGIEKAMELNHTLGSRYVVLASAGEITTADGWKSVAELLNKGDSKLKSAGLHAGYHNHQVEWKPVEGQVPMQILADNTDKGVMLQLDVGTCVEVGADPVAWINDHPGRIRALHLKEWSPDSGYKVLFGEGKVPWKAVIQAAEAKGGVEFYLIEQEGSRYPEFETADRCLVAFRNLEG